MWVDRDHQTDGQTGVRGAALLFGLMTVSAAILIFIGVVTTTLGDRVKSEQVVAVARAAQLARSGVEYALWEINYGGDDFAPPWEDLGGGQWRYDNNTLEDGAAGGGTGDISVLVDKGPTPWVITATGTEGVFNTERSVQVSVQAGGAPPEDPGVFDYVLYTRASRIWLYGQSSTNRLVIDGYSSNDGDYDAVTNRLAPNQVVIGNDTPPGRHPGWATFPAGTRELAATAVVIDGFVDVEGGVEVRTPTAAELPAAPPYSSDYETHPGFAIYDAALGCDSGSVTCDVDLQGTATRAPRTDNLTFQADAGASLDPGAPDGSHFYLGTDDGLTPGSQYQICAGDDQFWRTWQSISVEGATLGIGCHDDPDPINDPTDYFLCSSYCGFYYGDTQDSKVVVSVGTPLTDDSAATHAFKVAQNGATPGKVLVYSPTDIYVYAPLMGARAASIGSGGVVNNVIKGSGTTATPDPSKLRIYGKTGIPAIYSFSTDQDFHGVFHVPTHGEVTFENTSAFDYFGSVNARFVRTDNMTGPLGIHWDEALLEGPPHDGSGGGGMGCDPASSNCGPLSGSWTFIE